ncbi:hypothetical protein [Leucobacter aridicollis]|uniref:hypothetical protein n=1 Tax=Leucobacter aridicollis TaxID=283878 RepID=UPI0021071E25|nr:hypothetical protein [Leucobacter aridicollis]UTX51866.1 hypothetical protein KI794_08715 [Leucobacter aridicollis]
MTERRSTPGPKFMFATVVAACAVLALTACGPASTNSEPRPTDSEIAPAPGDADGEAAGDTGAVAPSDPGPPVTIPPCDTLIPLAQVQAKLGENFEPWDGPDDEAHLTASLGQSAASAFEAATEVVPCYWGVPLSDHTTNIFVANLPTAIRAGLVEDLRRSDYVESESQGVVLFTHTVDDGTMKQTNWFGFQGDVWVASTHFGEQLPIELAFAGIRAANPDWQPAAV